ncbi:MAG: DUF3343 domain-containing protein [Deltaproteobacteria bacterium]|nr:DUF3343 domain-containing protein [Deltaproteobacteria bacterium]
MEYLLAFGSAHKALKAESLLKEAVIDLKLLPAPKVLSDYCDLVIVIKGDDLDWALKKLKDADVLPSMVYKKEAKGYVKV